MNSDLFQEFSETSISQWKQKIQVDLKGADYNETLIWKGLEGVSIKPFYHKDDCKQLDFTFQQEKASICQEIFINSEKVANSLAIEAIKMGAQSIRFIASKPFHIDHLFEGIPCNIKKIPIHFELMFLDVDFIRSLIKQKDDFDLYLNMDPIGKLYKTGNWFQNQKNDFKALEILLEEHSNQINLIAVNAIGYQQAGASITQQLAYSLAHANEYLHYLGPKVASKIQFEIAIGGNYFFEIAKIRALQYLWSELLHSYDIQDVAINIFAKPSLRNKTIYDYNVNMLRTTTECMSALIGGVTTISNIAYDAPFHKKNNFGERISRNQLHVLNYESYFEEAQKYAKGTYFIEDITSQFAEKALILFKLLEKGGGLIKQLHEGNIQRKIAEQAQKEQDAFNERAIVLVGTNLYPNPQDLMTDELEIYPFQKNKRTQTLIRPVLEKRIAEERERTRLTLENNSNTANA